MRCAAMVATFSIMCFGCTPVQLSGPETRQQILIDVENRTALSPQWQSELINCSDDAFECIEAPGHFLMAFPRICPKTDWDWVIAGGVFRNTAPAEHLGLPSGGYVSYKYPYVLLSYRIDVGFLSLKVRSKPVMSANWGERSVAEYDLKYVGKSLPFRCH